MYKFSGYILGFMAGGIVGGLIIVNGGNPGLSMVAMFIVMGIVVKFFYSLHHNAEGSKFGSDDYFKNEKTKKWLREKIVKKMLYGTESHTFDYSGNSALQGIFTFYPADNYIFNPPHNIYLSIPIVHDIGDKVSTWEFSWIDKYKIIEEICKMRTDFAKDFEKIDQSYWNFLKIFSNGEVPFKDKKIKFTDLKEYHQKVRFSKKDKTEIKNNLGVTYEDLLEINKIILTEQKKWHDKLESAINSFVEHYCNSFFEKNGRVIEE